MSEDLGVLRRGWLEFVGPETRPATILAIAGLGGAAALTAADAPQTEG